MSVKLLLPALVLSPAWGFLAMLVFRPSEIQGILCIFLAVILAQVISWFIQCPNCCRHPIRRDVERDQVKIYFSTLRGICPHCREVMRGRPRAKADRPRG